MRDLSCLSNPPYSLYTEVAGLDSRGIESHVHVRCHVECFDCALGVGECRLWHDGICVRNVDAIIVLKWMFVHSSIGEGICCTVWMECASY
jgi:hypothetical protein